ncbi:hypothetical protein MSAN_00629600 [Mycena sanguinolenta]|uniref:Uncharacterized protein n=1 Tax=Mycena sanguinolenta TaxID=230812 RepID=A0A8H6Z3H1_9AGAR|nr:hypothetical protein MSAN_00629600 [Mycena sanguinolenta]
MLLILIAVHLLSRDTIAAPLPHPPDARAIADSCNDNSRTLFSVVWGCLVTIFACTWVSVHPNVPPPNQSHLQLFWRRLKMMLLVMIAPELFVYLAAMERLNAYILSKKFGFSTTHGMFLLMGGFVSSDEHPVATKEQLENLDLGSDFQKVIQNVKKEDITDKSKGDALSKGVALLQGLWFILQCLARAHQHLAITQLEVATLAFAVVNVFIWLLWWDKPLDVQRPIVIGPPTQPDTEAITLPVQLPRSDEDYSEDQYEPLSPVSVPAFSSIENELKDGTWGMIFFALVGTLFGAIHCAAWNAVFPTPAEMWIWRTSSLVITVIPGLTVLLTLIAMNDSLETTAGAIIALEFPLYIAARIILIVLPLAELRLLPASALVDVNWSTYIPHI